MLRTASRLVLLAGAIAAGVAGALALRADLVIGYGFTKAFQAHAGLPSFRLAVHRPEPRSARAEVGDEGYWLQHGDTVTVAVPVTLTRRPTEGEIRFVPTGDGTWVPAAVVAVSFVGTPIVDASGPHGPVVVRLMRVTFRVLRPQGAYPEKEELVHLWFQTEAESVTDRTQARTPRTT